MNRREPLTQSRARWLYFAAAALLLIASIGTLVVGDTPWNEVWSHALERMRGETQAWNPLLDERLPRLIVILCTGASLAVSGAVMQSLFHNPLASPMILGLTSGGSLLVVIVFMLGWHLSHPFAIPMAAFSGCLITLLVVYTLARRDGTVNMTTLILAGIALSTVLIAAQGALMYAFRERWDLIQILTEWEAGSTADRNWNHVHLQLPLTLIGLWGCLHYSDEINILALGEEEATSLGVEVEKVRWRLFLCVSLLTGGAIAAMGIIAFFGLVLPHVIRKLQGPDNRTLIPLCILAGSPTLAALDLILRVFSLHELSIGNVSAILGGIFFLILIFGSRHRQPSYSL